MQQLQVQRLQTLQARVEPQLLFDTLRRVLDRVPVDAAAADALLADLIALLRAMLPSRSGGPSMGMSDGQREFALLRSWAIVSGGAPPHLVMADDTARAPIAPMLVLPTIEKRDARITQIQLIGSLGQWVRKGFMTLPGICLAVPGTIMMAIIRLQAHLLPKAISPV